MPKENKREGEREGERRVVKHTGLVNFFERKHGFLGWQAGFVCMKAKK
jgi:hypothetical protein